MCCEFVLYKNQLLNIHTKCSQCRKPIQDPNNTLPHPSSSGISPKIPAILIHPIKQQLCPQNQKYHFARLKPPHISISFA